MERHSSKRGTATRARIVAGAGPLFVERGYLDTTMAALAAAGGVAVQTLYLSFGSKAAVLKAVLAAQAPDHPSGWPGPAAPSEPDGPAAVARWVDAVTAEVARTEPLHAVLRAAAADPEPAALLARSRAAALAAHARAVDELAELPGFTGAVSLARATDSAAALLAPEAYALLVVAQGWTVPDWAAWATRHLVTELFPAT